MATFILKRLGLALITLLILSVIVFVLGQVLPSDPGRSVLGPLAAPSAVHALDHQLGVDKPLITQYWNWITHFPGTSYQYQAPIGPILTTALGNSLKLALFAFVIVVPLGILGGITSALNFGKPVDRTISIVGQSAADRARVRVGDHPDRRVRRCPWLAAGVGHGPCGLAASSTQLKYLILPVIPLVLILFGYIARMARAGTVEALESDYARTATLKGLPRGVMIRRHVLRNSLLPTITVIATQTGYLIGGLVVVETLFRYNGIGQLTYNAANQHDIPMLEACVLTIGILYMIVTLVADISFSLLNPRIRLRAAE